MISIMIKIIIYSYHYNNNKYKNNECDIINDYSNEIYDNEYNNASNNGKTVVETINNGERTHYHQAYTNNTYTNFLPQLSVNTGANLTQLTDSHITKPKKAVPDPGKYKETLTEMKRKTVN